MTKSGLRPDFVYPTSLCEIQPLGKKTLMTNQQVIKHLNRIADVLSHIGYRFTNPTPIGEPATSEFLSSFEKRFPMPSVLKDFYLHASHVDFNRLAARHVDGM